MSSSSSFVAYAAPAVAPDHHYHHQHHLDQLCYVTCNYCDTFLAVSVPSTSLLETVHVRCGHCNNLLTVNMPVNMRALFLQSAANQLHLGHSFFTQLDENIWDIAPTSLLMNQSITNESMMIPVRGTVELPKPPVANRPPEKRQRVPSAYNRFIKEEIQRIKAGNPDISHREAFSAAAKNWAHFPHIHFGLMRDQFMKKQNVYQQDGDDVMMKDGYLCGANIGSNQMAIMGEDFDAC